MHPLPLPSVKRLGTLIAAPVAEGHVDTVGLVLRVDAEADRRSRTATFSSP